MKKLMSNGATVSLCPNPISASPSVNPKSSTKAESSPLEPFKTLNVLEVIIGWSGKVTGSSHEDITVITYMLVSKKRKFKIRLNLTNFLSECCLSIINFNELYAAGSNLST